MLARSVVTAILPTAALAVGVLPSLSAAAGYDLQRLDSAASAHGWTTAWADDGSLLLWSQSQSASTAAPVLVSRQESKLQATTAPAPTAPLASLGECLTHTGWQVDRDTDGSLLFWRESKRAQVAVPVVASRQESRVQAAAAPARTDPLSSLGGRLTHTGWQVSRDADGSLLFWTEATRKHGVTPVLAAHQGHQPQVQASAAPAQPDPVSGLVEGLARAGWRVSRDADGSVLMYPRGSQQRPQDSPYTA